MTTRQYTYDHLTKRGIPVETADEIAEATKREEKEVADCVILAAEGMSLRQIGTALGLSKDSVKANLARVREKV